MVLQKVSEAKNMNERVGVADEQVVEANKSGKNLTQKKESKTTAEKQDDGAIEKEIKDDREDKKEEARVDDKDLKVDKDVAGNKMEAGVAKHKDPKKDSHEGKRERAKDEKEKQTKNGKDGPKRKSSDEGKGEA
ncbi:uncharacterized protein LOC131224939 [Magnolia sinica]|uniref:uncharacterized protein LOC131224939 n=1 Tax=Magnolia sinica TaxID=86752 RepID=UPI00265A1B19|nr:uncharacterized protein LOC131224939 [Magnolia sinica]